MICDNQKVVYLGEGIWWRLSRQGAEAMERRRCEKERERRYRDSFKPKPIRSLVDLLRQS